LARKFAGKMPRATVSKHPEQAKSPVLGATDGRMKFSKNRTAYFFCRASGQNLEIQLATKGMVNSCSTYCLVALLEKQIPIVAVFFTVNLVRCAGDLLFALYPEEPRSQTRTGKKKKKNL